MEVHAISKEKGPLIALVLALIVLGLGSLYLTWRSIAHQRQIVEDHMIMTGSSILRGVDNNLTRLMRSLRMNPKAAPLFPTMAEELFTELAASEDIRFITLYSVDGKPIVTSEEDKTKPTIELPSNVTQDVEVGLVWHVMAEFNKHSVLISGLKVPNPMAALVQGKNPRGMMGHGMMQGRGHGGNRAQDVPDVFLVVGFNAEKHFAQFRQYRRAATYQTGYVFLAAVVLWSLAFAYMRRRGEGRKLMRMERFQNKLLDNMPDGLVTVSGSGEITAANHSAKRLLAPADQEGEHEILGIHWNTLPFAETNGDGTADAPQWQQYDYQGRQLEILSLPLQANGEEKTSELGQRLVLIRDRTEIRSLEEDLHEANRLAAIGSLAAGVAHEVRNPLSSLRGFAQLFANKLKGQPPLDQYATTMVQEADRLNRVVTDLLYLAKPRQLDPVAVDLSAVGESLRQLMRFDFESRDTELVFDFGPEPAHADQDALRQILLNLISNSLDAITGCTDCDKPGHIILTSEHTGDGVWITVADDGPGMPEDFGDEVLKPFVTGKKTGTGLGLAIVQNIMRAHKGKLELDSRPGEGMTIRLFFPDGE
ncbi:Histidine kinase [Pseudodesulfovibrio profundus]|uniref:histidine kinase n=1 Tax=Pseudodesulfovibrio profundus TaxID=57320 RepID=A0A2C8FAW4_9BACT|nr:ATP-binding protein [Pseudodesulfovibrio profundus]SOB59576.1 Histidine kinase [Pseudodesulfovibrio profundus]